MPSEFSRSPKFLKGALVVFETVAPVPTSIIVFQYNPETVAVKYEPQSPPSTDPARTSGEPQRVLEEPNENFTVSIDLDAADQLEIGHPLAVGAGVHPALAALGLLMYPSSASRILTKALAVAGSALVVPQRAPLVLLIWGPARVVPVKITSVSVTEQAFDQLLNPTQAKVELGMRTLNQKELDEAGPPFSTLGLVRQIANEALARSNVSTAVDQIRGLMPF